MTTHPLKDISVKATNFKCFGEEGGGFEPFAPINIVIGRNNSGKSALIDAIEICVSKGKAYDESKHARGSGDFSLEITQATDEAVLRQLFHEGTSGGDIRGNHWTTAGAHLLGSEFVRTYGADWKVKEVSGEAFKSIPTGALQGARRKMAGYNSSPFDGLKLVEVDSERDVAPEGSSGSTNFKVEANGKGLTNIVRGFINSVDLPRAEVEEELLRELNEIYQADNRFQRLTCQEDGGGIWEIYLTEASKGDVPLSQSGSSLKSVFIILAMLRLVPRIDNTDWSKTIFVVEEPENNLHPALLRRLLEFLARQRDEKSFSLVITTHSPICIDWASGRNDTQLIHVRHKAGQSSCHRALGYKAKRDVLDDLDIRASDILQANCVLWVEGPTDRLYLRRWIDLISNGTLKESVHYTIMFYGGRLLSHLDALPPDETDELISLISINRNAAILLDSDRRPNTNASRRPRPRLNDTKQRMVGEIEAIGGFAWVTAGREVENYIPAVVLQRIEDQEMPQLSPYDQVWKESILPSFKEDKVAIARAVVDEFELTDINGSLDLRAQLDQLANRIRGWNGLN
ncbi:MAG: AAA family ATPase [Pseudomonadota bacterium]